MQDNETIMQSTKGNISHIMYSKFIRTLETQGTSIRLVISPFVTGFNNFTINILDNNESVHQISNVSIEFKKSDAGLGPIFVKLVEINDTAYSVYGGFLSQFGNWDAKVTIKRFNLYDLNYRVGFAINKTASTGAHTEHDLNTPKLSSNVSEPSGLTPMVIPLSIVVAALSTYFCINAFQRMKKLREQIGL